MRSNRQLHRAGGFTLLEAAFTIIIIGTGALAILAAQQAFHRENDWAQRTGTAALLANELRELTLSLPLHDPITGVTTLGPEAGETDVTDYDDLDDFAGDVTEGFGTGTVFDPPINALRNEVDDLRGWSQFIEVANVNPDNISASVTEPLGTTDMVRIRVTIRYQSPQDDSPGAITQLTWVVGQ